MKINKAKKRRATVARSSHKTVAQREAHESRQLTDKDTKLRMKRINRDFAKAFQLLQQQSDTVTFFGSARFEPKNEYYVAARKLAARIAHDLGFSIVSGGGPGIMEAANRGANEACQPQFHSQFDGDDGAHVCGASIGMSIELPNEQVTNPYASHSVDFHYFFSRKVALAYAAKAYVFFPGGFGTLDEFFEILTLKQTQKIPDIPVILYGKKFWHPLEVFIKNTLLHGYEAISPEDTQLYIITDSFDRAIKEIKKELK
jgi:uncharacterized protein (TIGR00730 family)